MTVHLWHGEMQHLLSEIPDASIDCVLTDPPYGETSLPWDRWPPGWPKLIQRVLKPSGSMWVFGSMRMFFTHLSDFDGWHFVQEVIWRKHNGSGFFNDRFRRVHEYACQFHHDSVPWAEVFKEPQFTNDARARVVRRKDRPAQWTGARGPSSYVSVDGGPRLTTSVIDERSEHGRAEHPTQKPVAIIQPLLLYSTPPGGTVLDPFAGSGTTGVVARRHSRNAILIEARAEFIAVANQRIHGELQFAEDT